METHSAEHPQLPQEDISSLASLTSLSDKSGEYLSKLGSQVDEQLKAEKHSLLISKIKGAATSLKDENPAISKLLQALSSRAL